MSVDDVVSVYYGCGRIENGEFVGISAPSNAEQWQMSKIADELAANPTAIEAIAGATTGAEAREIVRRFMFESLK